MDYEGPLYGKIGDHYIPLVDTSKDVDELKAENKRLKEKLQKLSTLEMRIKDDDEIEYFCHACRNQSGHVNIKGVY